MDETTRHLQHVAGEAGDRARSFLSRQREQVAVGLRKLSEALHGVALRLDDSEDIAWCADRAADRLEQAARAVRERDLSTMLDQARGFARRQPAMLFGGSVVAGLALARFLKSSSAPSETTGETTRRGPNGSVSRPMGRNGGTPPEREEYDATT